MAAIGLTPPSGDAPERAARLIPVIGFALARETSASTIYRSLHFGGPDGNRHGYSLL